MSRRNRRRSEVALPVRTSTAPEDRREGWRGEQYVVRPVTAGAAIKAYRCPGCDQEIRPGVPHLVTWPAFDTDAGDRRHWHTPCWAARETRAPGVQRTRSAPRY